MAKPTTYKGSLVAIYLEDPDYPGVYIKPCGLNNHSVQFTKNAEEIEVPDCDDPEAPQWIERDVRSLDFSATGEGVLAAEALPTWWAAFNTTDAINARIYIGALDDSTNGYYWAGQIHVNSFQVQGQTGQRATVSIGAVSSGELTFTPVGS
jgi:hypothetical protein